MNVASSITLRPARADDAERVFAWRNRPEIVALGTRHETVLWETHRAWFAETVTGERRRLFIIEQACEPIGQIRFDHIGQREAEVSIYLLPEHTGRGLGVTALRAGRERMAEEGRVDRLIAHIRSDNVHSRKAFVAAGFAPDAVTPPKPGHDRLVSSVGVAVVPHNRLTHGEEEAAAVAAVVRSGQWSGGAAVEDMEARFARIAGVPHAVGVGSGLGALRLALLALDVGPRDVVALPAYSCVALANAVLACGARPLPLECDEATGNLCVAALRAAVATTLAPKAAIAVHTFGAPAPVRELAACGVPVIEDCSHAFGRGEFGSLGCISIVSLYATKLVGAGEGGVLLTRDARLAERIRQARDYTDQAPSGSRLNDKLTACAAALAACQLDRLATTLPRRDVLAARYSEALAAEASRHGFRLPAASTDRVWYRYVVQIPGDVDAAIHALEQQRVVAARPVEPWADDLPRNCARAFLHNLSLPLYPTLTAAEQDRVILAFTTALSAARRAA